MATAYNIKELAKVPAFIKDGLEGLKSDLEEILAAKDQVQAEYQSFKVNGA